MRLPVALGLVTVLGMASCKKDDGSAASAASPAPAPVASGTGSAVASGSTVVTNPQVGTLAVNALADTYPEGFAISALPAKVPAELPVTIQSVGTVALASALELMPAQPQFPPLDPPTNPPTNPPNGGPVANNANYDPSAQTVSEKLADATAKLKGEGDCFAPGLLNQRTFDINSIQCYNPDRDLNTKAVGDHLEIENRPKLDGTDEACMAGYGRAAMGSTIGFVDSATGLVLAMLCQAKKDGKSSELPALDATLDLKTSLQTAVQGAAAVTTATIKRLADQADGSPVYRTDVVVTTNNGQRGTEVHLLHSPSKTAGNATANGRLWIKNSGDQNGADHIEVTYARSGTATEPRIQYRLIQGLFKTKGTGISAPLVIGADPFDATGHLDLNKTAGATGKFPTDTNNDMNASLSAQQFIAFDVNPLSNVGKLMFWKNFGGNYDEAARGMVFDLEKGDGNALAGCSLSGATTAGADAGMSIRKALKVGFDKLTPRGYYHPSGKPQPNCSTGLCQFAPFVYKQCFRQDPAGLYLIDAAATSDDAAGFDILPAGSVDVTLPDLASLPELAL